MAARKKKPAKSSKSSKGKKAKAKLAPLSEEAEIKARESVIAVARQMSQEKLSPGRSGNVSCRWLDGMLITPSGLPYEGLTSDDVVFVDGDGTADPRSPNPSSEWRFHLSAYNARGEIGGIVHTHSTHATVLAAANKNIPAFHYMVAVAGGADIPLVPYAPFGTDELATHVAEGLAERDACLMANHGQIAVGQTVEAALEIAFEVEALAEQYYKVLTLDAVHMLDGAQMDDVLERFKSYRENAQG